MQRRPIWLLPMVYRVWAAGRARNMADWIRSWGGGAVRGAEELAWELSVELEATEAAGEWIAGAALDWRKAFDRIPLPAVSAAMARAGVPDWIAGP
eukprot:7323803-Lingulodinium_polyedra.AAC.1